MNNKAVDEFVSMFKKRIDEALQLDTLEAVVDAFNSFQAITEDGTVDCLCCQNHERIAKKWLKKYETLSDNGEDENV